MIDRFSLMAYRDTYLLRTAASFRHSAQKQNEPMATLVHHPDLLSRNLQIFCTGICVLVGISAETQTGSTEIHCNFHRIRGLQIEFKRPRLIETLEMNLSLDGGKIDGQLAG